MKTWHLFLPFAALIVLAGYTGFRYGQIAPPSEGDVIARWANEYVGWAGGGAQATDCVARPGRGGIWLIITCVPPSSTQQSITYRVTRDGALATATQIDLGLDA